MKKITLLLTVGVIFLFGESLSLKDAIKMAEEKNLQINKKELLLLEKKLDTKIVNGMHFGSLDLVGQYMRSNHPGNVFGMKSALHQVSFNDFGFDQFLGWMSSGQNGDILSTVPKNLNEPKGFGMYESFIEYKLPIFTGGMISGYKDASKKLEQIASLDLDKEREFIKGEVRKVFYDISLLRVFLVKLETIEHNMGKLLNSVEEFKKEGYAKNSDVLEVRARKMDVYRKISETKNNISLSLQYLSFLLNEEIEDIQTIDNSEEARDVKLEDSYDVKMAQKGTEITDVMVGINKGEFLPKIGAMARSGGAIKSLSDGMDYGQNYTVGVEMRFNIFNGFADLHKLEKAKVQSLQAKSDFELAKAGTKLAIEKTKTEISKLQNDVKYLESELLLKEEIYTNYKERYDEKLVSMNDLMIKHSEYLIGVLELMETKNSLNKKIIAFNASFEKGE